MVHRPECECLQRVSKSTLDRQTSPPDLLGSTGDAFFGSEGGSYLQEVCGFEGKPNNAPKLKDGGKLLCG